MCGALFCSCSEMALTIAILDQWCAGADHSFRQQQHCIVLPVQWDAQHIIRQGDCSTIVCCSLVGTSHTCLPSHCPAQLLMQACQPFTSGVCAHCLCVVAHWRDGPGLAGAEERSRQHHRPADGMLKFVYIHHKLATEHISLCTH